MFLDLKGSEVIVEVPNQPSGLMPDSTILIVSMKTESYLVSKVIT